MIITNVDLLAKSSNHKVMLPEYSRNISQMSVSKSFQVYLRNILRLWKYFCGVKKFKKLLFGLSCEIFNICGLISCMSFWTLLRPFFVRAMFSKVSYWCLTAGKKITRSPGTTSVYFSVVTVNDEYRKPEFKTKRRS